MDGISVVFMRYHATFFIANLSETFLLRQSTSFSGISIVVGCQYVGYADLFLRGVLNVTKLLNLFNIFIKYLHNTKNALIFAVKF